METKCIQLWTTECRGTVSQITIVDKGYKYSYLYRAQTVMKTRLRAAQKGHSLLKKKADALNMRFRTILTQIVEVSEKLPNLFCKN